MIKNYFKVAFRNLQKNKVFSFINVFGLAVGMAAALLIMIWVQNELSYDKFYTNQSSLYKLYVRGNNNGYVSTMDVTTGPMGKVLKNDFPEVKNTARIYWTSERLFNYRGKSIKAKGNDVDKPFLSMFTFPFLEGNAGHSLDDPNDIVVTKDLADKLFGNEDAMNKIITIDNKEGYKVTGVLKNLPSNTQFDFDYLVSLAPNENIYGNTWDNYTYNTYIQLQPNTSAKDFNYKIKNELEKYTKEKNTEMFIYPVSKLHLYSTFENGKPVGGKIDTIRLLLIIALLVLLIACINFMNLSTAQSQKRAKEVGVRKVIGARKKSLIIQFLCESIVMATVAGILALIIVELSLPSFNDFIHKSLSLDFKNPLLWLALVAFILFTGLMAGSYPAFFLSAFKPLKVLKGTIVSHKSIFTPRKILVVTQFSIAIILIISTIIVYHQIKFVENRNTGYNINNLVEVPIEGDIRKNYDLIKNELINKNVITAMCKNSLGVTVDGRTQAGYSWQGSNQDDANIVFSRVGTDGDFTKTMGLQLIDGRDIDMKNFPSDSAAVMLNETAVREMQMKDPVGKYINEGGKNLTIVGVFKDFIIASPFDPVKPMIVVATNWWTYQTVLRFNSKNNMADNLRIAEQVFKKYNPAYPFTYHFVDEEYQQKFSDEKQTVTLAALFAGLTIFISCLGLFGLAAYMAENRQKEIGIRKVLGANIQSIVQMLSKEFVVLVVISILIATPIGWWLMNKWLQNYNYRIQISWNVFLLAGIIAIVIALTTVSFQAIKAAIANPVKSLRSE